MNDIVFPGDIDKRDVYALLAKAVNELTGAGSSSVPAETAKALMEGVCFHIRTGACEGDTFARYERGVRIAREKTRRALGRCNCLLTFALDYGNITLRDTLKGLGEFFRRYNPRLFPLDTPGDIDYQLACPLDCELAGADYMLEYLRRLSIEERFTGRFAEESVRTLLRLYNPECDQLAINVFDMVFTNAVGKALIGETRGQIILTRDERDAVLNGLYLRPREFIEAKIDRACERLKNEFGMRSADSAWYLGLAGASLSGRLYQSLSGAEEKCELFLFE